MGWQGGDGGDQSVTDGLGIVSVGQVYQHRVAGRPLDQGGDRGLVGFTPACPNGTAHYWVTGCNPSTYRRARSWYAPGLVFTHISAPVPAIGPRTFAGAPVTSTSSGIFVPPTTSECAPIRLRAPTTAPSSTVQWLASTAWAPMCTPCTTQPCATVAPGPTSTGMPGGACSTQQSCTLAPSRTMIGAKSARMTALNHTDAPASTWTSPISVAVGAMNAPGSIVGDRPSNEYNGIV